MIRAIRWSKEPTADSSSDNPKWEIKGAEEEMFVEASSMKGAIELCPEDDRYEIRLISNIGNIVN